MHLLPFSFRGDSIPIVHKRYIVDKVDFQPADTGKIHVRKKVLLSNTMIEPGMFYNASDVKRTYNNFGRLQAVKYVNLRFTEVPDTNLLHSHVFYGVNKPSTISFQPEGTNTAGDLGAAASLTYENRNLFHGSENFSIKLRGAFEAITGLEGYQNDNYIEYGVDSKLSFPRFIMPFLNRDYRRSINAVSELSLSYNLQNRPEFHRRVFSTAWRYRWDETKRNLLYRFDLLDLNYIYMPWISGTFKQEYLDNSTTRNAILRYNYEDLFIMKTGFTITFSHKNHAVRANLETAGNLLSLASHVFDFKQNSGGQHTLFNIAFAQYVKGDFDYTKVFQFDAQNSLAFHAGLGLAYPYGNSRILPFEKRYFSGGANSVRGWNVRRLGPGSFKGNNGAIDFINQTGDMKLDLNLEYRTILFWKFYGAFFIDAGNIWTLREYDEQPGGQFKIDEFYKQIAAAYGFGVRLNFDYFILRFDMGMKAVDPVYESSREHFPVFHPNFDRDFCFHFAVGLPF
jgi:outer membrane protein assembly factor BamA